MSDMEEQALRPLWEAGAEAASEAAIDVTETEPEPEVETETSSSPSTSTSSSSSSLSCRYVDPIFDAELGELLYQAVASAVLHQTEGTFADTSKVAIERLKELRPFLREEIRAYRKDFRAACSTTSFTPAEDAATSSSPSPPPPEDPSLATAANTSPSSASSSPSSASTASASSASSLSSSSRKKLSASATRQVLLRVVREALQKFAHSKRSLMNRVSGVLSDIPQHKVDAMAASLKRRGMTLRGKDESLSREILRALDVDGRLHCKAQFASEDDLFQHRASGCPFRPAPCENPGCDEVLSRGALEGHDQKCPFKAVACVHGCGEQVPRHRMEEHTKTTCARKPVECPFQELGCSEHVWQGVLNEHLRDFTSQHLLLVLTVTKKNSAMAEREAAVLERFAELSQQTAQAAESDMQKVQQTVAKLEKRVAHLERENVALRAEVTKAHTQNAALQKLMAR